MANLDGKHIRITKPGGCGSEYYNYKKFHSFVLLALVDARMRFIWADIGNYGSNNDAAIFNDSSLCRALEQDRLGLPRPSTLPNSNIRFPYFLVGDEIFALREWLLKPYSGTNLSEHERQYNYR